MKFPLSEWKIFYFAISYNIHQWNKYTASRLSTQCVDNLKSVKTWLRILIYYFNESKSSSLIFDKTKHWHNITYCLDFIYSHVNYSVTKIVKFIEKIIYITQLFTKYLFNVIYNRRNYSILLNSSTPSYASESTTVEIILYYLTVSLSSMCSSIYNSRNYSILLNSKFMYLHNFLEPSNFIFIILYNICTIYVK